MNNEFCNKCGKELDNFGYNSDYCKECIAKGYAKEGR